MSPSDGRHLAHLVFFQLKDDSPVAVARLVESCHENLSGHEGVIFFAAGPRGEEFNRDANDKDFDVALNLVFETKAAHDAYQVHPRHTKFVADNQDNWVSVRVFDAYVTSSNIKEEE